MLVLSGAYRCITPAAVRMSLCVPCIFDVYLNPPLRNNAAIPVRAARRSAAWFGRAELCVFLICAGNRAMASERSALRQVRDVPRLKKR